MMNDVTVKSITQEFHSSRKHFSSRNRGRDHLVAIVDRLRQTEAVWSAVVIVYASAPVSAHLDLSADAASPNYQHLSLRIELSAQATPGGRPRKGAQKPPLVS